MNWTAILAECGVRAATATAWAPIFDRCIDADTFSAGLSELDDFLGQVLHESQRLERLEEGLFYNSTERLCTVWPSRFPTQQDALPFLHAPEKLADRVYGGRLGNTSPGDGYRYRGRGLIMVTGRANYRALAPIMQPVVGFSLEEHPELLAERETALRVSIAWWERRIPDSIMGDLVRVTRAVNGGTVGIADRGQLTDEAAAAIEGQS